MANVSYITFMKHAEKVTKSAAKTRPILKTVAHCKDLVVVTDSHRLYMATGLYEGDEKQVDPATGLTVDHGKYPEVANLIQGEEYVKFSYEVDTLPAYESVRAIEIAGKVNKATDDMHIVTGDGHLDFKTIDKAAFDVSFQSEVSASVVELETTLISIKYLKEALHVLKDAKVESFTLEFFGIHRPIQLRAGNFTAIVLPKRQIN